MTDTAQQLPVTNVKVTTNVLHESLGERSGRCGRFFFGIGQRCSSDADGIAWFVTNSRLGEREPVPLCEKHLEECR